MEVSTLEVGLMIGQLLSVIALAVAIKSLLLTRQRHADAEQTTRRLSREIALSTSGTVAMGQRLVAMEKRLQAEAAPAPAPPKIDYYNNEDFQPYSQAAQLFTMGLDCEEVARRCGLSRAETALIQMMQSKASEIK